MSGRPWTGEEIADLARLRADGAGAREIGAQLGRSEKSVEIALSRRGLTAPAPRAWAAADVTELERLRREKVTLPEIAKRLGRTRAAVLLASQRYGFSPPRPRGGGPIRVETRRLNAEGFADPEIAEKLGLTWRSVQDRRRYARIPSAVDHPRRRAMNAQNLARGRETIRARARAAPVRLGWPEGLFPVQVKILEALLALGPLTYEGLAMALGREWLGPRKTPFAKGSFVSSLVESGLVLCLGYLGRDPDS